MDGLLAGRVALITGDGSAVLLASDLARYNTGITMPVDGGFRAY